MHGVDLQAEAESALDKAGDDERLHGTRAIAANSPEPEVMLGSGPEEDCMWEEQGEEGEDDDGVQFISETGPGMCLPHPQYTVH